jgi:hypothetical protein
MSHVMELTMIKRIAKAGVVAASFIGFAGAAPAADLDYSTKDSRLEPYAPYYYHRDEPRQGQYYEEKRYVEPPPYGEKHGYREVPPPSRYSYNDDRAPPYRDYSRHDQRACLSKGDIRYRLKEHGWQDMQEMEVRQDTAVVTARRPDGMSYRLEVDRCSGVIVQARLLDEGRGWRQGSRDYGRTY